MNNIILWCFLSMGALAAPDQKLTLSFTPGQGVTNVILRAYFNPDDRETGRIKEYIRDHVDKTSVKLQCGSFAPSTMENVDHTIERQCEKKDAECCKIFHHVRAEKGRKRPSLHP